MATTKTTTKEVKEVQETKDVPSSVLLAPRMTEKASNQSVANAYTFIVAKDATKHAVASAIKKEYKVTPRAINITNMPRRRTFVRGKFGTQAGIKKAIVFLKKGDTIALA